MKRIPGILLAVFFVTSCANAQMSFGIKGGLNIATVGGADVSSIVKSRTGFSVGGYLGLSLPFLFTVQPEVLYSTKGFIMEQSFSVSGQSYTYKSTNTYSYLEIPVLVKYSLPVPVVNPSLYAGPEVGILLTAKSKFEGTGSPTVDSDVKSAVTSTDYGVVFGASAHILVADFDLRYVLGLKSTDGVNQAKMYNRVWSVMVGIPLL